MDVKDHISDREVKGDRRDPPPAPSNRPLKSFAIHGGRLTRSGGQTERSRVRHTSHAIRDRSSRDPLSIEIHIEELVLEGFDPREGYRIRDAVERELARLLVEEGVPETRVKSVAIERLEGDALRLKARSQPGTVGSEVAKSVCGTLLSSRLWGSK
jgi:hypothetical protein